MKTLSNIQDIGELVIAKGDTFNQKFVFTNEDGTIPDYTEFECYYLLSEIGIEDENILSLAMTRSSQNTFILPIVTEDTEDLDARSYTAKIVLKDASGHLYKKARGILTIKEDSLEVT